MGKLVDVYVRGRRDRREITRSTYDNHLSVLRSFRDSYGNRDPKRLSQSDVERWIESRPHLAAGTRRLQIGVVRNFVAWLRVQRHIKTDPMLHIKTPRMPRRVPRALEHDDDAAIEAVLPDLRAWAIYALLRWMGLRRCEVIRAEIGDWDRHTGLLWVRGKGDNERYVPVPSRAITALSAYFASMRATGGPMIRRLDGTGPISNNYLGRLNERWMREAGVKHWPYDGKACHSHRHTLASNVIDYNPDLRVAQQILGHVYLTSTQIYLRPAEVAAMRAAIEGAA